MLLCLKLLKLIRDYNIEKGALAKNQGAKKVTVNVSKWEYPAQNGVNVQVAKIVNQNLLTISVRRRKQNFEISDQ